MEQGKTKEVSLLSFIRLCLIEAFRTSTDWADLVVLLIGALLGPIALLFPRWETRVTHLLLIAPISALSCVILFRIFLSPLLVYRKRDKTAQEQEMTIRQLTEQPRRTPAEQHDFDTAKKALQVIKEPGVIALRHIRRQGSLTLGLGSSSATLPPGLTFNDALNIYNHCAKEGLLTCNEKPGSGQRTFAISPTMSKVLDELLFE